MDIAEYLSWNNLKKRWGEGVLSAFGQSCEAPCNMENEEHSEQKYLY